MVDRNSTLSLLASDMTGSKVVKVPRVAADSTVGELLRGLVSRMDLPPNDLSGQPLDYQVLHWKAGRHLHRSEVVGDVLANEDRVVLQPNIDAGSGRKD